jgi:hypothetical protein
MKALIAGVSAVVMTIVMAPLASAADFGASTGSTSGLWVKAHVNGTMDQSTARTQALASVKATRQDAYNNNIPIVTGTSGSKPVTTPLQTYLKTAGISESAYVNIGWNGAMEKIANQRAVESSVCAAHTRPDGTSTFTTSADGETSGGEILAWGYSTMASASNTGWAGEKADYLTYAKGGTGYGQYGHYSIMISPSYKSFAMSGFQYTTKSYGSEWSWSGEFSTRTSSGTAPVVQGSRSADFVTTASNLNLGTATVTADTVKTGESIQANVTGSCASTSTLTDWNASSYTVDSVASNAGKWTVSDASKASINATTGLITGKAVGTVTATFTNLSTGKTVTTGSIAITQGTDPTPTPSDNDSSETTQDKGDSLVTRDGAVYSFYKGTTGGAFTKQLAYGKPDDQVISGDWDGDGKDTLAVRRGIAYYFKNSIAGGEADSVIAYGKPGDQVLVGDWDGDGKDTLAVRRGIEYYFKNSIAGGEADSVIAYGKPGDQVLVGDWDGDGKDTLAVRRGNTYYFKNSIAGGEADRIMVYGKPDDQVVVGDWNGDGKDTIAVRRGNRYYFSNDFNGGIADHEASYGTASDQVLSGHWGL